MKILNKNININFSSGLTTKLLLKEKCTNPCKLETYLNKEFGIETNFSGNNRGIRKYFKNYQKK